MRHWSLLCGGSRLGKRKVQHFPLRRESDLWEVRFQLPEPNPTQGAIMAEQQTVTFSNKPISAKQLETEFQEHTRTYSGFLRLSKWGILITVAILIGLYFLFIH